MMDMSSAEPIFFKTGCFPFELMYCTLSCGSGTSTSAGGRECGGVPGTSGLRWTWREAVVAGVGWRTGERAVPVGEIVIHAFDIRKG